MVENILIFQVFSIILVAIIVYPKVLNSFGVLFKILFQGLGNLLEGFFVVVLQILEEFLKLLGVIIQQIFQLLSSFFKWLINLF